MPNLKLERWRDFYKALAVLKIPLAFSMQADAMSSYVEI